MAAGVAARAAEGSITALKKVERPHVLFSKMAAGDMHQGGYGPPACLFTLRNYGPNPGFLTEIYFLPVIGADLPSKLPEVPWQPFVRVLPPEQEQSLIERLPLTFEDIGNLSNPDKQIFLITGIRYKDTFDEAHESHGAYKLLLNAGENATDVFWPHGGPAYWRHD